MRRRIRSDAKVGFVEKFLGIGNVISHLNGRNVRSDCLLGTLRKKYRK